MSPSTHELNRNEILSFKLYILVFAGWSFGVWRSDWGDAYTGKMVPRISGLLPELPQYHAHSRRGCRVLDASGEI